MGQSAAAGNEAGACARPPPSRRPQPGGTRCVNVSKLPCAAVYRRDTLSGFAILRRLRHDQTSYKNRFRAGAGRRHRAPDCLHRRRRTGAKRAALPVRSRLAEADAQQVEDRRRHRPGRRQGRQRLGAESSERSTRPGTAGGDRHRRLLRAPAVDDPHRQERQRHRLVRCASGARHGRRQPGLCLHRLRHGAQIRSEERQDADGDRASRAAARRRWRRRRGARPAPARSRQRRTGRHLPAAGWRRVAVAAMPTRPPRRRKRQRSRRGARSIRRRRR